MKLFWKFAVLTLLWIILYTTVPAEGATFYLRPLSGKEVYKALHDAGREDAIPEGRVVSQGISGWAGFGLGLLKGIGGAAVVNALASALNTNGASSSGSTVNRQEICFNSRSLDATERVQGRQAGTGTTGTTGVTNPTTTSDSPTTQVTTGDGGSVTNVDDGTGSGTATETETEDNGGQTTNCIVIEKPS